MEQIKTLLASIDPKILYVVAAVLIVLVLLSLFKKAIKMTITLIILAAAIFFAAPLIDGLQDKYGFSIDGGAITFVVDDVEHTIADVKDIESVSFEQFEDNKVNVTIVYSGKSLDVDIPASAKGILINFLDKNDIKYVDYLDIHNN